MSEDLKPRPFSRKWITVILVLLLFAVWVTIGLVSGDIRGNSLFEIALSIVGSLLGPGVIATVLWFINRD